MTRLIPRELIKHLEWSPGKVPPPSTPIPPSSVSSPTTSYSIDQVINGRVCYDSKLPEALRQALTYATSDGIVATMPELVAAKATTNKRHAFWKNWHTVY